MRIFGRTKDLTNHQHKIFGAETRSSLSGGRWEQFPSTGYTSDPEFAARAVSPDTVGWLSRNRDQLPNIIGLDRGWCYPVYRDQLDPETHLTRIDLIAEFLDRIGVPSAA